MKSERGLKRWNEREKAIFEREAYKAKIEQESNKNVHWLDAQGSTDAWICI